MIAKELITYMKEIESFSKYAVLLNKMYIVYNTGKVFHYRKGNELRGSITKVGYLRFQLYGNGLRFRISAQRLIALCFIPNPGNKPQVNHKDGNKLNNHIDNLEWVTASENVIHAYEALGKKANKTGLGKFNEKHPRSKRILQISIADNIVLKEWVCAAEVKRTLGFSSGNICSCARGVLPFANGFKWKYA